MGTMEPRAAHRRWWPCSGCLAAGGRDPCPRRSELVLVVSQGELRATGHRPKFSRA